MATQYKNYLSLGKVVNQEYTVIPYAGISTRDPAMMDEIHELDISASSFEASINPDWSASIDVYIKDSRSLDGNNSEKKYFLYNNIILKDGGRWHNEKAIALSSYQKLCYSIRSMTSVSTGNNYNIQVTSSNTEFLDPKVTLYRLDVNATPSDANILLNYYEASTTSGYIIVPEGNSASYTVSARHYETKSGTILADANKTIDVNLKKLKCFKVSTNAPNATITLSATNSQGIPCTDGFIQEGNEIWVTSGTVVTYSVSAPHYHSVTNQTYTVQDDIVYPVNLTLVNHTLTITTSPRNATVQLILDGYTQSGKSITVPWGSTVKCIVSYNSQYSESGAYIQNTSYIKVLSDMTEHISMDMKINSVLFESSTPGTYTVPIPKSALIEVIAVGAGGGGAVGLAYLNSSYYWWQTASGGSGSLIEGTVNSNSGEFTVKVGSGGKGRSGIGSQTGDSGTNTTALNLTAGAGSGCTATGWVGQHGTPGTGGVPSGNIISGRKVNGNNGTALYNRTNCDGGAAVYKGYGKGGNGNGSNGGNGYLRIKYLGPLS